MSFVIFSSVLLAPVFGLVRVNVETDGAAEDSGAAAGASMVRTAQNADLQGGQTPYWDTWLTHGLDDKGLNWAEMDIKTQLVGKSYKGYGSLPTGFQKVKLPMQQLEFFFLCKDPRPEHNFTSMEQERAWVKYDTHRDWSKKYADRSRAMENELVTVIYEYAGESGKLIGHAYHLSNYILECKKLELSVTQILFPSQEAIEQNLAVAVHALKSVDPEFYTREKINNAMRTYIMTLGESDEKYNKGDDISAHLAKEMENQQKQIRGWVRQGILKSEDDYGLLQEIAEWSGKNAGPNGPGNEKFEAMGRFNFGKGNFADLSKPGSDGVKKAEVATGNGRATLAFEFTQDCSIDFTKSAMGTDLPKHAHGRTVYQDLAIGMDDQVYIHGNHANSGMTGKVVGSTGANLNVRLDTMGNPEVQVPIKSLALNKSPAHCTPGQKAVLLLSGDQNEWNQHRDIMPGIYEDGDFRATRLVLYLKK